MILNSDPTAPNTHRQGTFKVVYNDVALEKDFDSATDKTLLGYLESNDQEIHYQCLEGYCGACRCKMISGEVEYPIFPMAMIRKGEILTCCSVPVSDVELADPF
ncbi:MAG: ferredoxin [Phenylobacterium sp.]|jgi:ferredoxin